MILKVSQVEVENRRPILNTRIRYMAVIGFDDLEYTTI
ncbi:hypothetical protein GALL_440660 [mine drainage metagenome]|uniref:Uncharacterized protein n=1 Tax=mine drainage metagenome TaxID=410659 RepID=A0A1J5Q2R6_9ZZZZ